MSGTRLTRKVTVEGGKKLPEASGQSSGSSSATRRSVFDRLGPGTSERPRIREPYPPEKCRNWLRDGRCQFGRNCKFLHGPFSGPKQRTKGVRSIVRSDVDRSEERDDGTMGGRTRSLDSLEPDDDEEREIPIKKKKHRSFDESSDTGKKSDKVKRRQHMDKDSSEDEEEDEDEQSKRKRKVKKRQLTGGVVITKTLSPEQEERDWGDEEYEEERSDLDWEERGELDFERQLNLEKRRQDLQRQLALMDEEEAAREKAERKVKDVKKEKDEEPKPVIPVVHSKLHPDKSSVSPGDEFSPVSSQSTPKKKKKKSEGEPKKVKTKRKLSPSTKEVKKRKGVKPVSEGLEIGFVDERARKMPDLPPERSKVLGARTQHEFEGSSEEKPRVTKKKQLKTKSKESHFGDAYLSPSGPSGIGPSGSPPREEIPHDKRSYTPEEQRPPVEKIRRRTALSSPEGPNSPAVRYASDSRTRRVTDPSEEGSPRKPVREVHGAGPPGEGEYKTKAKGYDKRYKSEASPSTPEHGRRTVVKDTRHVEEGRAERRKKIVEEEPPRSPSPEDIPARGPVTPPEEQRRHRTPPPRGDRRGPQTPPGEPDFDNGAPRQMESDRAPLRHELSRGGRGHPQVDEGYPRSRARDEDLGRGRHREDRQDEYHQPGRPKDERADEFHRIRDREPERSDDHHGSRAEEPRGDDLPRRKPERDDEYLRRRDERDDDHLRSRNREPEKGDERPRRKDERNDEHQRGRVREEHEDDLQRSRGGRDFPRRQFEGGDERHWEGRGDRDAREVQLSDRDRRRPDIPRQDMQDNRSRERPGDRPRDREGRHPPSGPDYHRRTSPIPHGPRRSSPPHGPPRGPHRFEERRRSLSPGGRREESYRPGPPRDQGGYSTGREPVRGRGGYSAPFDNRSRPMEGRRRNSPPPRQYVERGRGAPRGRGSRGGRGFPDRIRPPGDRYQDSPRDRGAPWDPERRRERDHPRDRDRAHGESRDRDRRPRGEVSPGRAPRHWEDRRGGSPGRAGSPPRDRRAHEPEKMPREVEEERRRRSDDEEEEWEYEEDMGEEKDKIPRQGERKRPRETGSSASTIESPVGGKRRRSTETPEMEEAPMIDTPKGEEQEAQATTGTPGKQTAKLKKKKVSKKEGKLPKTEEEANLEVQVPQESPVESEELLEGERPAKAEKKNKKEKGKVKEKITKKKKKIAAASAEESEVAPELAEEPTNVTEESGVTSSENLGEVTQPSEEEPISKVAKKRRHPGAPEGEETKVSEKDGQLALAKENDDKKSSDETQDSTKVEEPLEVFSDWSDDSPIGDDTWSDINEPEIPEHKPKTDEKERKTVASPVPPAYDDVYDPISDDELDAMLGDEDEEGGAGLSDAKGSASAPMAVEEVDWSALVSAQSTLEKTGQEPGSHLKRFTPGHVFSRIGISSSLAGPRLTKLVQKACAEIAKDKPSGVQTVDSSDVEDTCESQVTNSVGALMAGAAAKARERELLFSSVGPCRRALCARRDLAMRKRLRRLTGKVGLFQTPPSAPVDNELYSMSVALYKHEHPSTDSSVTKLIPSRVGTVLTTVNS
ncbi:hypothetical protein ACROYT_G027614 [Oculina patagonica]